MTVNHDTKLSEHDDTFKEKEPIGELTNLPPQLTNLATSIDVTHTDPHQPASHGDILPKNILTDLPTSDIAFAEKVHRLFLSSSSAFYIDPEVEKIRKLVKELLDKFDIS